MPPSPAGGPPAAAWVRHWCATASSCMRSWLLRRESYYRALRRSCGWAYSWTVSASRVGADGTGLGQGTGRPSRQGLQCTSQRSTGRKQFLIKDTEHEPR